MGERIDAAELPTCQLGSAAQHPPCRTQDQEQAAAKDKKAGGHGLLSLERAFTLGFHCK